LKYSILSAFPKKKELTFIVIIQLLVLVGIKTRQKIQLYNFKTEYWLLLSIHFRVETMLTERSLLNFRPSVKENKYTHPDLPAGWKLSQKPVVHLD
jgi:hypothetical protein